MTTNSYYQASGQPVSLSHGSSATIRTEFGAIQSGFDSVSGAIAGKSSASGQNYTGTHDFSGATVRIKQPVVDADPVSYGYVKTLILNGQVPTSTSDAGKFLTSDGTTVSFQPIPGSAVTSALGFTPYNASNPAAYISGITGSMVSTALGYTPYNAANPAGYISGISSQMVTSALGFTPYNATNPSGYITNSALSPYLTSSTAASTYLAKTGGTVDVTSANASVTIKNTGHVGDVLTLTGTGSAPNKNLRINASTLEVLNNAYSAVILSLTDAGTLSATTVTGTSDERKKSHWHRAPLDLIERLAGLRKAGIFRWKKSGIASLGVGAQSLEAFLPEAVHTDEKGNKSVNYGGAAMVGVVELSRRVLELEARLAKLEAKK